MTGGIQNSCPLAIKTFAGQRLASTAASNNAELVIPPQLLLRGKPMRDLNKRTEYMRSDNAHVWHTLELLDLWIAPPQCSHICAGRYLEAPNPVLTRI